MESEKKISTAVIKRLPRYYRFLGELISNETVRISSRELSLKMGVTASQIRQDLNNFGGFGQQGYGYNVEYLYEEISKILGLNKKYNLIIVGVGNLGQALANYPNFDKRGFNILGLFDVNPRLIGNSINGKEIMDIDDIEDFVKNNDINIGVLTLPKNRANEIAKRLVSFGVNGIWNFSPIDLNLGEEVIVENVYLLDSLMTLSYNLKEQRKIFDL